MQDKQIDDLKTVFLEGNPYFLGLTFVVSLLHSVFDMLAFKNDIGFWKSNKSMEGLSATTIIINAVCQVIIFLYLLDNETSTVVLLSAGVHLLLPPHLFSVTCGPLTQEVSTCRCAFTYQYFAQADDENDSSQPIYSEYQDDQHANHEAFFCYVRALYEVYSSCISNGVPQDLLYDQ